MKVILIQDVANLGKKYEVKEVKNGFARNYLLPQKLVRQATRENLKWLEIQKKSKETMAETELMEAQKIASNLDGLEVAIPIKVGEDGQIFESVNSQKIVEKLKELGFEIKKTQVKLEKPIKELGEFPLKIGLDHNLEAEITVLVTQNKES